jgi:hypothetical protein
MVLKKYQAIAKATTEAMGTSQNTKGILVIGYVFYGKCIDVVNPYLRANARR